MKTIEVEKYSTTYLHKLVEDAGEEIRKREEQRKQRRMVKQELDTYREECDGCHRHVPLIRGKMICDRYDVPVLFLCNECIREGENSPPSKKHIRGKTHE